MLCMIRTFFVGVVAIVCLLAGMITKNNLVMAGIVILALWLLYAVIDEARICSTLKTTGNDEKVDDLLDDLFGEKQLMKKTLDEATEYIIKGDKKNEK